MTVLKNIFLIQTIFYLFQTLFIKNNVNSINAHILSCIDIDFAGGLSCK
jgi:hypothetical protein